MNSSLLFLRAILDEMDSTQISLCVCPNCEVIRKWHRKLSQFLDEVKKRPDMLPVALTGEQKTNKKQTKNKQNKSYE